MANIRVNVARNDLAATVRGELFKEARRRAEMIGRDAAKKANDIVRTKYKQREYERRRHPGSRRAAGAISYKVSEQRDFPITVSYRVLGGEDVVRRIIILNFGRGPSDIVPSGTWPLRGRYGSSRFVRQGSTGIAPRLLAWPSSGSGAPDVFRPSATSGPSQAGGFLEEAMKYAVSRNTQ